MSELLDGLRDAGAEVIEVPAYRWELPEDLEALDELVLTIAQRDFDGVTFTAGSVVVVLKRADAAGRAHPARHRGTRCPDGPSR